jgi:Domain of unknown function (DUF4190)
LSEPYSLPPPPPPPTLGPPAAPASREATTALVLGILGLVCCGLCAPFAWYFGQRELTAIRAGMSPKSGESLAMAGKILGIIGSILFLFGLIWVFFFGGMMLLQGLAASH